MSDDYYERMYWECQSEITFLEEEIARLEKLNKILSIENASLIEENGALREDIFKTTDVPEWMNQMIQEQKDYYQSWYIKWCKEIERRANGDKSD